MKDNRLEIGDVLYDTDRWRGLERFVIDRLTAKTAFAGHNSFKIELENGRAKWIRQYGCAELENDKFIAEFKLQSTVRKAYNISKMINFDQFNLDQANQFLSLAATLPKHKEK